MKNTAFADNNRDMKCVLDYIFVKGLKAVTISIKLTMNAFCSLYNVAEKYVARKRRSSNTCFNIDDD